MPFAHRGDTIRALRALSVLVILLSLFLATRRMIGSMATPLAVLPLVMTAIVLLLWVFCVRIALRVPTGGPANLPATSVINFFEWSPFISLVLIAFACSYPGARFIDWLVWIPTIAAAWFGPQLVASRQRRPSPSLTTTPSLSLVSTEPNEQVLQQLTRVRTADGHDALRGTLTAEFAPAQRTADLYVAFCPPFERLPTVEAEIEGEDAAAVKLIQVLHNGAQFEVRLARPAERITSVSVELFAADSGAV